MSDMDELKALFSNNLKYYLNESKFSQVDLTNYMHVSSSTVSDWCNGKKLPRMDKIQKICEWLKITRDDLLEERCLSDSENSLSWREKYLLEAFDKLNSDGKQKVMTYLDDLLVNEKYKKDTESSSGRNIS